MHRMTMTCPTAPQTPDGKPHTIIGCGSANLSEPDDEGLVDCYDCGMWHQPSEEVVVTIATAVAPATLPELREGYGRCPECGNVARLRASDGNLRGHRNLRNRKCYNYTEPTIVVDSQQKGN